ncbi:MAG: helix-turn-helix domain-containing protein [Actinomycetota bacterium]|nr:helix-turn-helix domain-containing protein [Actinomycetota bacterium]
MAEVAGYLGVGTVTVYRRCREGRLPCLKVGRLWRIRGGARGFLEPGERPATLVGQLRGFLGVPDCVIVVAETPELLHRLDAAFMEVGEARGAMLVKFHGGEAEPAEELRAALERNGLDATRLEEGRQVMVAEDPPEKRTDGLRRVLKGEAADGRTVWASFNWTKRLDVDRAIAQQEALTELADARQLVTKTAVLERVANGWDAGERRRAWNSHSGTISLPEAGLSLARVTPLSPG